MYIYIYIYLTEGGSGKSILRKCNWITRSIGPRCLQYKNNNIKLCKSYYSTITLINVSVNNELNIKSLFYKRNRNPM